MPPPAQKKSLVGLSLIFGARAVIETIRSGRTIEKVFLQQKTYTTLLRELYNLVRKHEVPFSYVPVEKLDRMAHGNHQGVVAILSSIVFAPLDLVVQTTFEQGKIPMLVVLDGVTDVHNIGAIARTALCMGVDALVVPTQGSGALDGAAMKISAGALATLPVCRVADLSKALRYLEESGLTIVACHAEAERSLHTIDLTVPIALILGGEEGGISSKILKLAAHHMAIPMQGHIGSFNVSVAAGIALYEAFRQRYA